jgi:hypothetical protein
LIDLHVPPSTISTVHGCHNLAWGYKNPQVGALAPNRHTTATLWPRPHQFREEKGEGEGRRKRARKEPDPPELFVTAGGRDDATIAFILGGIGMALLHVITAPNHPAPLAF